MSRLAAQAQDEKYSLWHNTGIIKRYTFFFGEIFLKEQFSEGSSGISRGQYLI